ncbi:TolC family protein [Lysobacter brunescens]|uniref:TolC family protein n=1 Tax=Lysobacter brunescens TaxID=262323 RepID=A0ABW2YGN2_9GAMM
MHMRLAALAAWVVACALAWPVHASERPTPEKGRLDDQSPGTLTLDDAFARVASHRNKTHPELRLFDTRRDLLQAERDRALQRPAFVAGATLENALGSGDSAGLGGAELTLSLASVLERGGKLDARRTLAQSRIDALAVERETTRLDLLAEVARRHLAAVAAEHQRRIAEQDITQRRRTVAAARQRLQAGASPESVVFTAQAALARAELERDRAVQRGIGARQHLAALWGERDPRFVVSGGDPLSLPTIEPASALATMLDGTPELVQFIDEQRIREARLQLARSEATPDLDWQVGVRRLQTDGDIGLVGGVSMALGTRGRAEPSIRAAEAELASLEIEREARGMSLYSTLADARGRYALAQVEVRRLRDEVLPKLAQAESAAERAYRAGAISYLEWAQLQSERTQARRQQLDAALEAQRALIELQRLTGQTLVVAPNANAQGISP